MDREGTMSYIEKLLQSYEKECEIPAAASVLRLDALKSKMTAVSASERLRLAGKCAFRLLGIRKCLFLGGYRREEKFRQRLQDLGVYEELQYERSQSRQETTCVESFELFDDDEETNFTEALEQVREILANRSSYLALVTDTLDTGGMEEVICFLAEGCRERQIPVRVLCLYEGGAAAERLRQSGIRVKIFHGKRREFTQYLTENSPSLMSTHFVSEYLDVAAQLDIPIVETIHNMYVFLTADQIRREQEKARYVNRYIAVSDAAKRFFLAKVPGVLPDRITVVGNAGKCMAAPVGDRMNARSQLGLPSDIFVLLAAGSIHPRKNQLGILRAWDIASHLADRPMLLLLAGETADEAYERRIRDMIRDRGLEETVRLPGYSREMEKLMTASDACIVDSYYEGWSMAATEALMIGLPLIHSACGSGQELVRGGNGILTGEVLSSMAEMDSIQLNDAMQAGINDNIKDTAAAILNILEHPEIWEERSARIRETARKRFAPDRMFDRYMEVFADVCKKKYDVRNEETR